MEAWFIADRQAVVDYFRKGLRIDNLPDPANDIERLSKAKILAALDKAARRFHTATGSKRQGYDKVEDGFSLLERIDPEKVCRVSKHARRLKETLDRKLPDRS